MRRVYWLSVLYHGKQIHQFSVPCRPWGHPAPSRRGAAKLSQGTGVAPAQVQRLTLQMGTAPDRQALSSRAGPEPDKPQLPSACKEAMLERRRWGTGKNASCLMEMQSLEPAVLTLGNSMFLPQMKCSFCKLVLVGFLPPPRLYKQNQH